MSVAAAKPSAAASAAASAKPAATGSPAASGGTTVIRFGTIPSIASEPMYLGADSGDMAKKGLDVQFTSVTSTPETLVAVASGKLDMGISSISAAFLNAFARGTDIKVIASGGQEAPGHAAFLPVLVRTDLYDSGQIKAPAQLKGHKVALNGKATGIEFDLYEVLKPVGLKVGDTDIVTMPWPDMLPAFANKSIDAGLVSQPLATQAVEKGLARILADDYAPGQQNAVMVANNAFLKQHADAASAFLAVYVQMIRRLNDGKVKDDDAALASIQKWTKTEPDVVKKAPNPYWPPDGRVNVKSVAEQQTYFLDNKEAEYTQPIDIQSVVDESYLDQALKQIGS
ncbi:MAG TPA: ABC transporter substrate-binding protein [Chloroflexota bacterium]